MASIRRTLSPGHHDRSQLNGTVSSPPCVGSPSHKLFSSTGKHSSSSSSLSSSSSSSSSSFLSFSDASLRRFLPAAFPQKRKGFRRFFYRCLPFFVLGFLLGIFPFGQIDTDIRHQDLSFEIKPSHFNVRLDENDNRSFKHNDFAVNTVSFGVDTPADYVSRFDYKPRKQLIVVSPTYNRALQAYFLNKLGQVLRLVQPPLLWIVVEMNTASTETGEILSKTGVMYRHLVCAKNLTNVKDQRVHQRNVALEHIETHRLDGIVYFANDDNVYSLELLESMRAMGRFGTWPVAILAQGKNKAILEGPVCNGSEVIGWHANEKSKQLCRFHVDMSGFAFNSTILWEPKRWRRHFPGPIRQLDTVKEGFQETAFIQQLVEDESQMEGEPQGCSRILNWHLHLDAHDLIYPRGWLLQKNLDIILPI